MSEQATRMRSGGSTHRDAPPPIDLVGHGRALARAALPALLIALLVGAAVFGLRTALTTKQYEATVIAQISTAGGVAPGDAYIEQLRAPFVGLANDATVLDSVLGQFDTGWDGPTLAAHTKFAPGPSPAILSVTVRADSPELAGKLARAMVVAVDQAATGQRAQEVEKQVAQIQAGIAAAKARNAAKDPDDPAQQTADAEVNAMVDEIAKLQVNGGSRLMMLSAPNQSTEPVAPKPLAESIVAGLFAFIVAAEAIVFARGRFGERPTDSWARRVARKYGAGYGRDAGSPSGFATSTAVALSRNVYRSGETLILLGTGTAVDVSAALPEIGADATYGWVNVQDMESEWWRTANLNEVVMAVVVVAAGSSDRALAERTLRELSELAVPTDLVLQTAAAPAAAI
ncbi:hypothetical protein [Rhodococcus daqingensis]|uniref:hypothetical protein n=1 Tax=Rhodococcus daqingensis TaxID=2479363 RepID=UPI00366E218D